MPEKTKTRKKRALPKIGTELYRGPSLINGEQIAAAAPDMCRNRKTADMLQCYILVNPDDKTPLQATQDGSDIAICGECPHRHYLDGACYVQVYNGPRGVAHSVKNKRYRPWNGSKITLKPVRLGAYGDPAAVPYDVWLRLLGGTRDTPHTGYTSQWRKEFAQPLKSLCMASVTTNEEEKEAQAMGWRTFRTLAPNDAVPTNAIKCPANELIHCDRCLMCDGAKPGDTRKSIYVHGHGARKNKLNKLLNIIR